MGKPRVPDDFKDFLKLLNSKSVEYLLIGGYAVGYYGYPRATADMDIFVNRSKKNAKNIVKVLKEFGFTVEALKPELFVKENQVIRLGVPPLRLEILTTISGVSFSQCYRRRNRAVLDGVEATVISLADLRANKAASGRPRDLDDLQNLPQGTD
jgi:predicted nucleotidyltransferase